MGSNCCACMMISAGKIEQAEGNLRVAGRAFPEVAWPRTIPGIGEILTPLTSSETGPLWRFRSGKASHASCHATAE